MRHYVILVLLVLLCELTLSTPVSGKSSLVVRSVDSSKESEKASENDSSVNPKIYSMDIHTNVSNRFATTLITSKVKNLKKEAAETTFSVIVPENAFISEFSMEIDGKVYTAYVKEKEEARQIYQKAISRGQSAGHVELSARDSKTFTVSVNIEPESKTIFRLTYEELLQRQIGQYELIININPGQIVDDLNIQVHINESKPLIFVRTPSLRTGNEISKNDEKLDPAADIDIINSTSATVKFSPDKTQQKEFAELLGKNKENGLAGQFVVQYDVERDPQGGEVLVRDGYFVHFFSPSELEPLQKHVVFVLDHSGSMSGRKIDQLIDAMQNILSELKPNDLLNIVRFHTKASTWNITENKFDEVNLNSEDYGNLEPQLRETKLPEAVEASKENIEKAKEVIKDKSKLGMTNIMVGLEVGLFLIKRTQEKYPKKYQPMVIFLTDGGANEGVSSSDEIVDITTKVNSGTSRTPIFSLSFGNSADKDFLRKLSSKNLGFSRHIFEAADASLQLQDFYRKVSSPLLTNITFKYVDGVKDITKNYYPFLFNGSELVVAGRTDDSPDILLHVDGICTTGLVQFKATRQEPVSSLERLWAYLTVKQILKERESANNKTELTKKALDLSLQYSFVTEVSSLVVVKPNQSESVDSKKIEDEDIEDRTSRRMFLPAPRGPFARTHFSSLPVQGYGGGSFYMSPRTSFDSSYMYGGGPSRSSSFNIMPHPIGMPGMPGPPRRYPQYAPSHSTAQRPNIPRPTPRRPSPKPQTSATVPQWLETIRNNNENITTPQGIFKLGKSGDVTVYPDCPKTPLNSTGECTLLLDCPAVFPSLTDVNVYLQYFCPLNEFAGVCCPKKNRATSQSVVN